MLTELHRHMDISLRPGTLLTLLKERALIPQETSLASFQEKLFLTKPLVDLKAFIAECHLFQQIFDHPRVLEQVAFEVVEDCWNEGLRRAELRYAPTFVSGVHLLSWEVCLQAFQKGIQRALLLYPEMKVGLICIALRDDGAEKVDQVIEFFLSHFNDFVGVDLAGNEGLYPGKLFEASFKKAIQRGSHITIHSGEATGPESVWQAIEGLGAQRIGHGVSSIQDPQLVRFLADKQICLEMCPTSNWITSAVPSIAAHPFPKLLRAGVPVSINTDDPSLFGVSHDQEVQNCLNYMGLSLTEIEESHSHALRASFIP